MRVLGIMDSHVGAAAVLENGRVVAAVREEVLNRQKGFARFPRLAIAEVLRLAGLAGEQIDAIAFGIRSDPFDAPSFQAGERGIKRRGVALAARVLPGKLVRSKTLRETWVTAMEAPRRRAVMTEQGDFLRGLGLLPEKATFVDHHRCHALTALLLDASAERRGDRLIVVCDGAGDGDAGGVWVAHGGELTLRERVAFVDSLGSLYSRGTRVLGMKPWEHEYKVMGLAAYGLGEKADEVARRLDEIVCVQDGRLRNPKRLSGPALERAIERRFRGTRFDHAAAGLQLHLERTLSKWIGGHVAAAGLSAVCASGGVFLNARANHVLGGLEGLETLFVMPPSGDESAAVGAALAAWVDAVGLEAARTSASPLRDLYWGPAVGEREAEAALAGTAFKIERPRNLAQRAAAAVTEGRIVGRCTGRMEFGPRALGHRSIVCRPDDLQVRDRLNRRIKMRDFWMPFGPTVLEEHAGKYLQNPKGHDGSFMIRMFDTTPLGRQHLAAAIHPVDGTTRPQLVSARVDPEWHGWISAFSAQSGLFGVLNTSFNLHGEPIVASAEDALSTFSRCDLDHLQLGPFWVSRDGRAQAS